MVYRVIGMMSGSSLDGMDLVFAEFQEAGGKWTYEIQHATCYPYPDLWKKRLSTATGLTGFDYMLLHSDYGHYTGQQINRFIAEHQLEYKVGLITSHGHTTFHHPPYMTAQLGDGAAIAAETGLPVVTDLRAMDVALGGQGAPIVPMGEKWLLGNYSLFLNLGGIANISANPGNRYIAFDICPANRVLNMLVAEKNMEFDAGGKIAAGGVVDKDLLDKLNKFTYYGKAYPKSLANDFGTDSVFPLIRSKKLSLADELRTYVEHIALQIQNSIRMVRSAEGDGFAQNAELLVTGGGVFNYFLINRITSVLEQENIKVVPASDELAMYKEALIMAFLGVLRWREEPTAISSVTGASKQSIGGALWMGQGAE